MTYCHRGFNVWGPGADSATAHNPQNDLQPGDTGYYSIANVAQRAALLNSDIIRRPVFWSDFQTGPTTFDYTKLNQVIALVEAGRHYNSNLKVLPYIDGIPNWVEGRVNDHYVGTTSAYSQYGQACKDVLAYLNPPNKNYADFIELSNEPNGPTSEDGTNIPEANYGAMAAYANFWIDACLGPTKHPLIGALSPRFGWDTYIYSAIGEMYRVIRDELYPISTHPTEFVRLANSWRASFHAYPGFQESSVVVATNTVNSQMNRLIGLFGGTKVWITETGISSNRVGENVQAVFLYNLANSVVGPRPAIEGLIWFPLNDSNPYAWDSTSNFYKFGVVREDNNELKPAGGVCQSVFGLSSWA